MNFKAILIILAGFIFAFPVRAAELVFQGFGKPWVFYSGTEYSEDKESVSMPVLPGGMYIGTRQNLITGTYACSFEYKFAEKSPSDAQFQFSCTSAPPLYLNLAPNREWTPVKLRIANTKPGTVKFGLGIIFPEKNILELRKFTIERLSANDFKKLEYPIGKSAVPYWFNRSSDRKNTVLSGGPADDHALGGSMIQLKAGPEFDPAGSLCLMTLNEPLPKGKNYRLTFWSKSDKEGTVRAAVSDHYHTYKISPEWKQEQFEFRRKTDAKPTTAISFQTLNKGIRAIAVKDVVIEQVR